MRQLLFDEISSSDMERLEEHLRQHADQGPIEQIYFVEFPDDLLTGEQCTHENCRPFCFALETGKNWVKIELLVRSRKTLHCSCIQYADREQMDFILRFSERLVRECNLRT
ncbi:MAG: hypothetical protein HY788_12880 [Deltaproteobacteria bacterium]|nr:hypothetical protein [Deltaproteobacteria bacterium]